jgi:hypothetical protein
MMVEWSLSGVLFPPLLVAAILAAVATAVLRRLLRIIGAYRLIWHPALFDLAAFVLLLAGIDTIISGS